MEGAKDREKNHRARRWLKRLSILLIVAALAAAGLYCLTDNSHFEVTEYSLRSDRVEHGFRIALLADLHEHEYGENNCELVRAIRGYQPDLIIMAGDMVNADDTDVSVLLELCEQLSSAAPICFVLGNHEGTLMFESGESNVPLDQYLSERGVDIFYSGSRSIELNGDEVTLGAFAYSEEDQKRMDEAERRELDTQRKAFEESDGFRIAISHYPTVYYKTLYDVDADLAVAGHFHGGVVRLPYLEGLYGSKAGLFPKYSGGKYHLDKATLIVSRGLGDHGGIPRINNKPELVMIDILPAA